MNESAPDFDQPTNQSTNTHACTARYGRTHGRDGTTPPTLEEYDEYIVVNGVQVGGWVC